MNKEEGEKDEDVFHGKECLFFLLTKFGEYFSAWSSGKRFFPIPNQGGQADNFFLFGLTEIGLFERIGDDVVEFLVGTVVVGDEFPLTMNHRKGHPVIGLGFASRPG